VSALDGVRLACAGCGWAPEADDPRPFRCARAGTDDVDHVLVRTLDPARVPAPDAHPQPFARWRGRLRAWHLARAHGVPFAVVTRWIEDLDARVAAVDGRGFRVTPFARSAALSDTLGFGPRGGVWVKDETGNVSGSHKGRHLFGLALHLEVVERLGLARRADHDALGLAIASCGNAALAAAVVARATGRPLSVFIPTDADPRLVGRLHALGARIAVCERRAGERGDPCVDAFRRALASGALPFAVQGSENGLTVEGGMTLAWELAEQAAAAGVPPARLFVQVGGGALASACAQGLREAVAFGTPLAPPRLHAVQTAGAWPLRRAYERVRDRACAALGLAAPAADPRAAEGLARRLATPGAAEAVRAALAHARARRAEHMWAWESAPHSVAHGILDDETYDWAEVVGEMLAGGGHPVTADEDTLREAESLARGVGYPADATGSAGLAGLVTLRRAGVLGDDEPVVVLMTGARRG
jgi:threonine synthase